MFKGKAKWMILVCLTLVLALAVAACGQDSEDGQNEDEDNAGHEAVEKNAEENNDANEEGNADGNEGEAAEALSGELVVYSSRNENFVQPLLDKFEEETGVKVNALHGDEAMVNRIEEEANNVQADVFISNDVGGLEYLRQQELLEGFEPHNVDMIEEKYRAEDNSWIGLSARSRGFIYNKDLISEEEMPQSIEELADSEWEGKFAITRGGNGSMIAHVSALRNEWGDDQTVEWLSTVKDNAGIITEGHGDIRRAVGEGEITFGLVNNYYYHQQLEEPEDNNVGFIYPDQGEDEMGVFVNAAGVALIKDAPNQENAQALIEWLLTEEGQKEFSYESMEVPLNPDIQTTEEAARIDDYKVMDMPLSELGEVWVDTRQIIEQSGLDLEIR